MNVVTPDRIEKQVVLRAPRARVWRALTDHAEFEQWFGMRVDGPFAPGARLRGTIVGTSVDPAIAKAQRQFADVSFEIVIERIEPERLFSFRWHPFAVEPGVDYSSEPMTLIEFALEEVEGGVRLTVTESGFERIPLGRRARAFQANEGGWGVMVGVLDTYLRHAG